MTRSVFFDERELLKSLSRGDEQAFRYLFDTYHNKVYHYALKLIKTETIAEDILHDVFIKILQYKDLLGIEDLESFLMTVTRNKTLNALKRRQLELKINQKMFLNWEETHNETEESIYLHESEQMLNRAVSLLPPQQQQVYNLCHRQGLKYSEAAKHLSLSPLTVKTHMQLALRFLRKYMTTHGAHLYFIAMLYMVYGGTIS